MLEVYEEKLGLLRKYEKRHELMSTLGELIEQSELSAVHKETAKQLLQDAEQI
ncbi:hypothetical protein D3C81_1730520 [compost metagenome]